MDSTQDDWWLKLISVKAAIREQFPPLSKVLQERPGSASDLENKRRYKESTELAKERAQRLRAEQSERRRANRSYNKGRADARPSSLEDA